MASTTPKAWALGAEIKTARKNAHLSQRELGRRLGMDHSMLSRYESGERIPDAELVATILGAVGCNGAHRDRILSLARDPDSSHWLAITLPEQQTQLNALLMFERTADTIISVSPLLIPGLLQTPEYVRAVMTAGGVPDKEVETRVATRLGRRHSLDREPPVRLEALIGEAALRSRIGGRDVMLGQLRYLIKATEREATTIRVMPLGGDWNPALEGSFTLTTFEASGPIVNLENRRSSLFLHEKEDLDLYRDAVDKVRSAAMSPADSTGLIAEIANQLELEKAL